MIIFQKIRWMNLLSTGNDWTEMDLNTKKTSLIVGENGAGKSTVLDALFFALYGRPFRKINKPLLINSMTNKNFLVELEFDIGTKKYMVRRGIKPNVFEIYKDGDMLDQFADAREYQTYLETKILKMNEKACRQIVVLGSARYTPFMQLSAGDRREVIENLLDLQVFSIMNTILKQRISQNKKDIQDADTQLEIIDRSIDVHNSNIDFIKQNNTDLVLKKQENLTEFKTSLEKGENEMEKYVQLIAEETVKLVGEEKFVSRKKKIEQIESQLKGKKENIKADMDFFHENDDCPTCSQEITNDLKQEKITHFTEKQDELVEALTKLQDEYTLTKEELDLYQSIRESVNGYTQQMNAWAADVRSLRQSITSIEKEIADIEKVTGAIDDHVMKVKNLKKQKHDKALERKNLIDKKKVYDSSTLLLKDTGGTKTKIIRQYVPIMNQIINQYLTALDFFVAFELDEKFNETIRSRHRDTFQYESFSEGEKFRIDISLMLTWREIAKKRNSVATNLLIMDEVFDGSLDAHGVDEFSKLLDILAQETNIFVISHKGDLLYDRFDRLITFEKYKNFSRIKQSKE